MDGQVVDAVGAADRYRRAAELAARAKAELIEAVVRDHDSVNISGLSRRAGLHESTLYHWVENDVRARRRSNGRAH